MNVMRAAVHGENRLKSMPNNTVIMVSFAATFALALGATSLGNRAMLPPNAKALIEETTQVLERIGSSPRHRKGLSVLFARHIRRIMQSALLDQPEENHAPLTMSSDQIPQQAQKVEYGNTSHTNAAPAPTVPPEPYVFDMTDDQILEAINNASTSQDLFQLDETMFFDWLDWPNVT
jgi:hypothetical protein